VAALTVLVVSCPCALSLATPAALTAAMTRLREAGLVLTRSAALEQAAATDLALIDKTGTLTVHEPQLDSVELLGGTLDEASCLALAGSLQQHSAHPLARAFRGHGGMPLSSVETVAGKGVRGRWEGRELRIGSPEFCGAPATAADRDVLLAVDGKPVCRFVISDRVREDARSAVAALRALDVEPVMVSGDSEARCAQLAGALGLEHRSRQTPESKLAFLQAKAAEGRQTLMLGDGINDVPVLAGAALSAAVVEASDLVKSRADVLLLSRRLEPVAELIRVARRTRRITRQNLAWAAAYNATAIPIAALGLMPPWLAAIGMASSSTLVMLNATRILR
jgi:Cu2+-exporting ATPase